MDSFGWHKLLSRLAIKHHREGYGSDTSHDQMNPATMETHFQHNLPQEIPFHPIVGFVHVKFYSHFKRFFGLSELEEVEDFMGN